MPSRKVGVASKLLVRKRSLLLHLFRLKYGLDASGRAAKLVSKERKELLGRSLVTLWET